MEKYQICIPHQEPIIYIGRDSMSNELIGFCYECVPTAKVQLKLLRDIQTNIENNKISMIQNLQEQKTKNIQILTTLKEFILKYKNQQAQKFDAIIQVVIDACKTIEKKVGLQQKQLGDYSTIDIDKLYDYFENLGNEKVYELILPTIQNKLIDCSSNNFFIESCQILNKFPLIKILDMSSIENKNQLQKIMNCKRHNENVIGVDLTKLQRPDENLFCLKCISKNPTQFISVSQAEKMWVQHTKFHITLNKNLIEATSKINKHIIQKLKQKLKLIDQIIEKIYWKFNKYSEIKIQQNELLKQNLNKLIRKYQFQLISISDIEQLIQINNFQKYNFQEIENILKYLKPILSSQYLPQFQFKNFFFQIAKNNCFDQELQKKLTQYLSQNYQSTIKQTSNCYSIAFNYKINRLVAGCNQEINLYEFLKGKIKLIQQLQGHSRYITCLVFIKKSNNFVSGSKDSSIKLWQQQEDGLYICAQTIEGHKHSIISLVINQKGDQIVSGGRRGMLRFWKKQDQNWQQTQKFQCSCYYLLNICMNISETKLISCSSQISIFEQIEYREWQKVQEIDLFGYRMDFINDNLFSFQPDKSQEVLLFEFDNNTKKFSKKQQHIKQPFITIDYFFYLPQQFIKSKQILINKCNNHVNIIKILENGELKIQDSIEFHGYQIYGTMSDDGEYLVTWNDKSKEIQVRQYSN